MSDEQVLYRRVLRRETHSPRSFAAVLVAVVAILALVWLATECVLALVGARPLLLSPAAMTTDLDGLAAVPGATLAAIGGALVLVGLVLLVLAVAPGRRARHVLPDERAVIVVDDEVIASALVRVAARAGGLDPDRTVASVGRRRAEVRVTPTSGAAVDRSRIGAAVTDHLTASAIRPAVRGRIRVARAGRVGG